MADQSNPEQLIKTVQELKVTPDKTDEQPAETGNFTLDALNEKKDSKERGGGFLEFFGLAGGRRRRRRKSRKSKRKSRKSKKKSKSRRSRRKRGRGGNEKKNCPTGFSWDSVANKCMEIDIAVPVNVDHEGNPVKTWSAYNTSEEEEKKIEGGKRRRRKSRKSKRKSRRKSKKRKSRKRSRRRRR